ncbi:MAG: 3-isopropylmalate dehydratase small subunit [Candidatus Abyssubacteria bacterium]
MERLTVVGTAWTFGNNVDTDQITPSQYMHLSTEEMSEYVFEPIAPGFAKEFKRGEIIVAGSNFGCGSSRETAPDALKFLGTAAIVAESFGRIFFRNAIAIGLPVLVCPNVSKTAEKGDKFEIDFDAAEVRNLTKDRAYCAVPLNDMMLTSLKRGGIMKLLAEE